MVEGRGAGGGAGVRALICCRISQGLRGQVVALGAGFVEGIATVNVSD